LGHGGVSVIEVSVSQGDGLAKCGLAAQEFAKNRITKEKMPKKRLQKSTESVDLKSLLDI
jgi:hypothetical protein